VFLRRADAEAMLAAVLRDEPESRDLLSVVELRARDAANLSKALRNSPSSS
jgi:hypothetical protein